MEVEACLGCFFVSMVFRGGRLLTEKQPCSSAQAWTGESWDRGKVEETARKTKGRGMRNSFRDRTSGAMRLSALGSGDFSGLAVICYLLMCPEWGLRPVLSPMLRFLGFPSLHPVPSAFGRTSTSEFPAARFS